MKKTTTVCNKIAALTAALLFAGTTGAWAQSVCGLAPVPPSIPDDGATASEEEIEAASSGVEEYAALFEEYNVCAVEEYNATIAKFEKAFDDYVTKMEADRAAEDE